MTGPSSHTLILTVLIAFHPIHFARSSTTPSEENQKTKLEIPYWSVARIEVTRLGKSLDNLATFSDQLLPNIGALAKSLVAQKVFFPIPLEEGLDLDRPAHVFILDPTAAGLPDETALIIPLADGKKFKDALALTFGIEEEEGLITLAIPQGFDKPEKRVYIKIKEKLAFAAPNKTILEALTKLKPQPTSGKPESNAPFDVRLSIHLESLMRLYQGKLESIYGVAEALLPQLGLKGARVSQNAQETLAELETLDLRAAFTEKSLSLTATVQAKPNTPLALLWAKQVPPMKKNVLSLLPKDGVALIHAPARNFIWTAMQVLSNARNLIQPGSENLTEAFKATAKALLTLGGSLQGDVSLTIRPAPLKGLQIFFAAESAQPEQAGLGFEALLSALARLETVYVRGLPEDQRDENATFTFKQAATKDLESFKIKTLEFVSKTDLKQITMAQQWAQLVVGWPVKLQLATHPKGLLLALNLNDEKERQAVLKSLGTSTPAASESTRNSSGLQGGTDVRGTLTLLTFIRMLAKLSSDQSIREIDPLLKSIPAKAVSARLETGSERASIVIDVPASFAIGVFQSYLKLRNSKIDFSQFINSMPFLGPKRESPAKPGPGQ